MGCVATTSKFGVSSSSSGSGESVPVTIPNVFKMKKEQAIAELRRAGVQGDISEESSLCGSVVEGRVIEMGEVCYQHPPGGRVQGSRLVVSIVVQTEDPWHGNVGTHNEWRLMPKLVGMTVDQARAEMSRVGFQRDERVQLVIADEAECKPNIVCRQYPGPLDRAGINDGKIIYVGRDPNERRHAIEEARPESVAAESSRTEAPRGESSSAPKPEPAPESFFTVAAEPAPRPERASSASSSGEKKKWGGNGAPAFRDEANVPQGPGGPMNRGKGEPCTDKIDHCMRPGVWFAVGGVIAGRQYRATPAFELDKKWWNWYGQAADYALLWRTKVVEKPSELVPGEPVVWLVQEDPRNKWVTNDFDALTTSRWTSGVIESVDTDTFRVKGWSGPIAIDTARVIVETKKAE
ncbi:MAG: hypothetical protein HOV81_36745 [Kofleriaceae bacterium]|nr:hypothetical protein [Kofleriaceae bacterium]